MKRIFAFALLCTVLFPPSALAESGFMPSITDLPPVILNGFTQFAKSGTLAAVDAWLAGSARENDDDYQDAVRARLDRVRGRYGQYLGFEVVRGVVLSRSTNRYYLAVKFEKGIGWMSFDCYRPAETWIVTRFDFQTNANLVFPPNILGGQ
jgi:hypothetical protein